MFFNRKNLVIASSSPDEAITSCILKHKHYFDCNIDIVFIRDLLNEFEICDELSDKGSFVHWFNQVGTVISNQTHVLLNRTLSVEEQLFSGFIQKDREYAKREFEAYLGYSFSSFEGTDNQTVNGVCGTFFALPEQWQKIQAHTDLSTPEYYWGPKAYCPLMQNTVHSDVYNLFNWSTAAPRPRGTHIFCFEKPEGMPLFVLSLGKKTLIQSKVALAKHTEARIRDAVHLTRSLFDYFIFEILFFIRQNHIQFGCVNLELTQTSKHPAFETFVCEHLIEEYIQCLN